jgi:predicted dehydrogenase
LAGCGLIGHKRAESLGPKDTLVGCFDVVDERARQLAGEYGATAYHDLARLLELEPDVVLVAAIHSELAAISCAALQSGAHVLVEKPAGLGVADVDRIASEAERAKRLVKVGFNHRFHPGIARAIAEARSGAYGDILYLRGRYGHGGRLGYEKEWRADPKLSGGGEVVDQGMHLLDLSYWLLGDLPLQSSLLRTQFWNAPVDDNAVLLLGERGGVGDASPFSLLHVSWTEWKNTFSLEIACHDAKITVDGLGRSYGRETLRIYRMRPELGPPDLEEVIFEDRDDSWSEEWRHFAAAIQSGDGRELLGGLDATRYAWNVIEQAQQP